MKSFINRTGNPVDALICAVAFCIPLWPLGTIVMTMLWLAVSIITFNFTRFKQGFKDKPYLLIFIGFFLIHVVGLVWTQNIEHGFKELKDDLNLLIFPLLFGFHRPKAGSYRFIAKGFVAGTILGTLICFVQGFYFSIHTGDWGHMFYALFSALLHPTYFGMILIVSVMMVLVEFFEKRDTNIRYKYLLVFLVLLQMAAISLLSSRIVYLVAIALFFYFIFIMMMKRKYDYMRNAYVLFMTVCSFLFIFAGISMNNRFAQVTDAISTISTPKQEHMESSDSLVYNSSTIRLAQFRYSMEIIKDHWMLGVGTGDSRDELTKVYQKHNDVYALEHFLNPHSFYFHTWIMVGLAGLLILLSCIFVPYIWSYKNQLYLYQGFLVLIFINGFTDIITHATLGSFYAFINCLLYCAGIYILKSTNDNEATA